IAGCLMVLVMGLYQVGGVGELRDRLAAAEQRRAAAVAAGSPDRGASSGSTADDHIEHTSLILPVDTDSPFPWTGIYFGLALILSPAYWIGNQAIIQRSLGARSEFEAKASYVWGAVLK